MKATCFNTLTGMSRRILNYKTQKMTKSAGTSVAFQLELIRVAAWTNADPRRFQTYLQDHDGDEYGQRNMACIAVSQYHVDCVLLEGPPPNVFDVNGMGWVDLISVDPDEGYSAVGLSFLFPRAYSLLDIGWHQIAVGPENVFAS